MLAVSEELLANLLGFQSNVIPKNITFFPLSVPIGYVSPNGAPLLTFQVLSEMKNVPKCNLVVTESIGVRNAPSEARN